MRSNGGCVRRRSQSAIGVVCCNPAGDLALPRPFERPRRDPWPRIPPGPRRGAFGAGLRDRNQPW